jgi:hypothetical protein
VEGLPASSATPRPKFRHVQSETLHPRTAPGAPGSARSATSEVARDSVCTCRKSLQPSRTRDRRRAVRRSPAKSDRSTLCEASIGENTARHSSRRAEGKCALIRLSEAGADRRWLIERGCGYFIGRKRELTPLHRSSEQDSRAARISPPCGATFHYAATRDAAARRARGA